MTVGLLALGRPIGLTADAQEGRKGSRYSHESVLEEAQRLFGEYTRAEHEVSRARVFHPGRASRQPAGFGFTDERTIARSLIQQLGLTVEAAQKTKPEIVSNLQLLDAVMGKLRKPEDYYNEALEKIKASEDGEQIMDSFLYLGTGREIKTVKFEENMFMSQEELVDLKGSITSIRPSLKEYRATILLDEIKKDLCSDKEFLKRVINYESWGTGFDLEDVRETLNGPFSAEDCNALLSQLGRELRRTLQLDIATTTQVIHNLLGFAILYKPGTLSLAHTHETQKKLAALVIELYAEPENPQIPVSGSDVADLNNMGN